MSLCMLRGSRQFASVFKGKRFHTPLFTIHYVRPRTEAPTQAFGFILTRKIGKACARNRLRRRLRHILDDHMKTPLENPFHYVIRAYRLATEASFADISYHLLSALKQTQKRAIRK